MLKRASLVSLLVLLISALPAAASQPAGLAGKLIANPDLSTDPNADCGVQFGWYQFFFDHQLEPADTLILEMAIRPFGSGTTEMSLNDSTGRSFVTLNFQDGAVNGVPYHRTRWNDVTVMMRPATQDYLLSVNGQQSAALPYDPYCQGDGGCFTLNAFTLLTSFTRNEAVAWIDTISIYRVSSAGQEGFYADEFDRCGARDVSSGGLLIAHPRPDRTLRAQLEELLEETSANGTGSARASLSALVESSLRAIMQGEIKAVRGLEAFVSKLEAARGRSRTPEETDDLIARARDLLGQLEDH